MSANESTLTFVDDDDDFEPRPLGSVLRSKNPSYDVQSAFLQPAPRIIAHLRERHNLAMVRLTRTARRGDGGGDIYEPPQNIAESDKIPPFAFNERLILASKLATSMYKDHCFFLNNSFFTPIVQASTPKLNLSQELPDAHSGHYAKLTAGIIGQDAKTALHLYLTDVPTNEKQQCLEQYTFDHAMHSHNPYIFIPNPPVDSADAADRYSRDDIALAYTRYVVERAGVRITHCIFYQDDATIYISLNLLKIMAVASDHSPYLRITHLDIDDPTITLTDDAFFRKCIFQIDNLHDTSRQTAEISSPITAEVIQYTTGGKTTDTFSAGISSVRYVNATCISAYKTMLSVVGIQDADLNDISKQLSADQRASVITHIVNAMTSYISQSKAYAHGTRYVSNAFKTHHTNNISVSVAFVRLILDEFIKQDNIVKRPRRSILPEP